MTSLAQRFKENRLIVAPGVFDMISLRIADRMGFECLYMTGYGTVASYLGLPDAGLASYTDMVDRVAAMARMAKTPIICDADTGYGGLLNVRHTVRGYESAGAAGIQIEDQEFPKKCGHTPNRRVIPMEEMVKKVKVAVESRSSKDFLIVARTDARTAHGIDEALRRGEAYAKAGADVLFIESPESIEEMEKICKTFAGIPLLANMVEKGRTPLVAPDELQRLGYRIAIYPGTGFLATGAALDRAYRTLKDTGTSKSIASSLYDFNEFNKLMGFEDVWEFDRTHAE
ncbi:MAG TPA: isocitrate lyase/PEP mutase family protein [Usitatibacter sp.]|nr:isocitrate lyase/PEP mutase family protein [Usitatibacter sp.]